MKYLILKILSYLIPKNKGLHVYISLHDPNKFSGNIKALILYSKKEHPEIESKIFVSNREIKKEVEEYGVSTISNKYMRLWYLLRAEIIFVDATTKLFKYGRFKFVQLWHGVGFKCVGLLWKKDGFSQSNREKVYEQMYKNCILVATTSQSNLETQNAAFATKSSAITGYPRNDIFFNGEAIETKLRRKYKVESYKRIITYAPTFRDKKTKTPFSEKFWGELNQYLKKNNEIFIVKKHPMDRFFNVPNHYSNIRDFSLIVNETQELLVITNLLITDYSSISTDFSITERPILIYAYDIKEYTKTCRDMHYDIETILPKPFIYTEDGLLDAIQDKNWNDNLEVQESYRNFRSIFHHYLDGDSSKRVMEKVLKL